MNFKEFLQSLKLPDSLSKEAVLLFKGFFESYQKVVKQGGYSEEKALALMQDYIRQVVFQMESPNQFDHYHQAVKTPYDYSNLSLSLCEPLIDYKSSTVREKNNLSRMQDQLLKGENVILLSNHQTEADPQLMVLTLRDEFPELASRFVFVAGHRVTQDILAIPLSLGLNLLCIYSKNYIESPPEKRAEKQAHNQRTLKAMKSLLEKGGVCIYVACSGGRDRRQPDGHLQPAPFDPQSIELFYLLAKQAKTPTHFYPLAMHTYDTLPPPDQVVHALGEPRIFHYCPVHFYYGKEIDIDNLNSEISDKKERRKKRAQSIWEQVNTQYSELTHD
jgi:glycerol-3-phosphate O-acyltransferase